jgi:hypothetical protein
VIDDRHRGVGRQPADVAFDVTVEERVADHREAAHA